MILPCSAVDCNDFDMPIFYSCSLIGCMASEKACSLVHSVVRATFLSRATLRRASAFYTIASLIILAVKVFFSSYAFAPYNFSVAILVAEISASALIFVAFMS